jgi:hypothetical protein
VDELSPRLWTWTAPHPNWTPNLLWPEEVRSYAMQRGDRLVLFDPIAPLPELLDGRAFEIALTAEWHKRSSPDLGAPVHDAGDPLPDGVEERPAFYLPEERFLWLPDHRALILGDSLPNAEQVPDAWLDSPREDYKAALRPLLELPIGLLLPTHGDPILEHAHEHLTRVLT